MRIESSFVFRCSFLVTMTRVKGLRMDGLGSPRSTSAPIPIPGAMKQTQSNRQQRPSARARRWADRNQAYNNGFTRGWAMAVYHHFGTLPHHPVPPQTPPTMQRNPAYDAYMAEQRAKKSRPAEEKPDGGYALREDDFPELPKVHQTASGQNYTLVANTKNHPSQKE